MNILITGASSGLGFETALYLLKMKDHKVLAIARSAEKLQSLLKAAEELPGSLHILPFDLLAGKYDEILIPVLQSGFKQVDVLINNAGQLVNRSFLHSTTADFEHMMQANFFSHIGMIKLLIPFMKGHKSHILNIGSMGGYQGSEKFAGLAAYSASKAALMNLTECLASELKDLNIAVNGLALGSAQTEMLEKAFPDYKAVLSAKEMAEFIAYFACHGHAFFNGKILPVAKMNP